MRKGQRGNDGEKSKEGTARKERRVKDNEESTAMKGRRDKDSEIRTARKGTSSI